VPEALAAVEVAVAAAPEAVVAEQTLLAAELGAVDIAQAVWFRDAAVAPLTGLVGPVARAERSVVGLVVFPPGDAPHVEFRFAVALQLGVVAAS